MTNFLIKPLKVILPCILYGLGSHPELNSSVFEKQNHSQILSLNFGMSILMPVLTIDTITHSSPLRSHKQTDAKSQ